MKEILRPTILKYVLFMIICMVAPIHVFAQSTGDSESNRMSLEDADYWLDRGALYATYGNQEAAIRAFKKVFELDPQNSEAYFNLAIAYGENGEYRKGLDAVNQAIDAQPENGRFYYGRGWLYQFSGQKEKAVLDIRRAAELGNEEARNYLENIVSRKSM